MAALACLKKEFTEDEKYHNLTTWLNLSEICIYLQHQKGSSNFVPTSFRTDIICTEFRADIINIRTQIITHLLCSFRTIFLALAL